MVKDGYARNNGIGGGSTERIGMFPQPFESRQHSELRPGSISE